MRERAIRFGKSTSLVGIVTEPSKGAAALGRPAVILLNSGILHRVGACRLHVKIARALAEKGFCALRFDFSGIGDSEPRRDSLAFEESAPREVQDAMDRLEDLRGCREFVLFGLCSGADVAFLTAPNDRRVVGVVQLDAAAYLTRRWHIEYYKSRACDVAAWKRFLQREIVDRVTGARKRATEAELFRQARERASTDETYVLPTYVREFPPRERFGADLARLVARGVQQLFVYTGSDDRYNYRDQLSHAFPAVDFTRNVQVDYWPEADHIFTDRRQQLRLTTTVVDWASRHWPGVTGAVTVSAASPAVDVRAVPVNGRIMPAPVVSVPLRDWRKSSLELGDVTRLAE